jgi:hypothetical protein
MQFVTVCPNSVCFISDACISIESRYNGMLCKRLTCKFCARSNEQSGVGLEDRLSSLAVGCMMSDDVDFRFG